MESELPSLSTPVSLRDQVRALVLDNITSGKWRPGEAIPGDQELANRLGVHYHTVRTALSELAGEKYLVRRQGRGTFVAELPVKQHCGVLFGTDREHLQASGFLTLFAEYAQEFFDGHGRRVKPYLVQRWVREGQAADNADFLRDVEERSLQGCLLVQTEFSAAGAHELLMRKRIPFATASHNAQIDYPTFGHDLEALVRVGMDYLASQGYRRIALVCGRYPDSPVSATEEVFYRAYQAALDRLDLERRPEWIKDDYVPGEEAGYRSMKDLWALGQNRPDAILCCDNVITQGMIHAWWELGLRVPRDLGFVTHAIEERPFFYPVPLTQMVCGVRELVEAGAQMLIALVERTPPASRSVLVEPQLVVGRSCGEN